MKKPTSLIEAFTIAMSLTVGGSNALHVSPQNSAKANTMGSSSRRFFMTSTASLLSTTLVTQSAPANAAWLDNIFNKKEEEEFTYDAFKDLVQSKKIKSVQFSWNGSSLTCIDSSGKKRSLEGIPDDPSLLVALVNAGIDPTVDDFPYEKHMSSSGWFRDSVLRDDTLTDEEKYKYRGYKTFRENIPENRVYIPSNLISN
ncbi:unnamed protein product [Cylindrotheca closterium]|uniref:Uncharacterized protein n=1 Tax=Cylindrotheca closterium TaxID=2856 RepID=A0AAD2FFU4_9STRA|nr:unnamed protein product [Cylindrotheca closterium]